MDRCTEGGECVASVITLTHYAQCPTQSQAPLNMPCPPAPGLESDAETHFITLVLKVVKLCIIMKEGGKPTSFSFSHVPQLE